jgi:hypothetical protein
VSSVGIIFEMNFECWNLTRKIDNLTAKNDTRSLEFKECRSYSKGLVMLGCVKFFVVVVHKKLPEEAEFSVLIRATKN